MGPQDDEVLRYERAYAARFDAARRTGRPVFLCREQRPGWREALPLYVLCCRECGTLTVSHPAGYGRIDCRRCRVSVRIMTWRRFRDRVLTRERITLAVVVAIVVLTIFTSLR